MMRVFRYAYTIDILAPLMCQSPKIVSVVACWGHRALDLHVLLHDLLHHGVELVIVQIGVHQASPSPICIVENHTFLLGQCT
jgi:hypothetical protein